MKFTLELPSPYRLAEILSFHGRDLERIAEDCSPDLIRKGSMLAGIPVVISISLHEHQATCTVQADQPLSATTRQQLATIARGLLGLNHDATLFEKQALRDKLLGPLIRKQKGLRIPQTATPFEALTWAIIGQQINLTFATTLRRTLIQLAGRPHSSGLWCYPDAPSVAQLDLDALTSRKFSRAKAETILRVARMTADRQLILSPDRPAEEMAAELLAIKGIGPWTVNYVLLRGLSCPDCSLHGDAGVKAALRHLLGTAPTTEEAFRILEPYTPHRSWTAAHLWASLA